MGLDLKDYRQYLSNVQYCKMQPFNRGFSKWIDDKFTLKCLCYGAKLDKYMPKCCFEIDSKGNIFPLLDYDTDKTIAYEEEILELLREKYELAIKIITGAIGEGFYKAEYVNGKYLLNGVIVRKIL